MNFPYKRGSNIQKWRLALVWAYYNYVEYDKTCQGQENLVDPIRLQEIPNLSSMMSALPNYTATHKLEP